MAETQKGIYYPDNYSAVADIPADMEDLAESVDTALDGYQGKVSGKGLSTNDFTNADKEKLEGIEAEANKTIVDNALSSSSTNPVQNKKVYEALGTKVDKVTGKGLSTNDYTDEEKAQVATNTSDISDIKAEQITQNNEIEALQERDELIISQIPTEDVSGETIDITDSSDLPFEKFEIEGNSTQETTTGAQLLNITRTGSLTINGITFTLNPDKSVTVNGTATASADYNLISANDSNNTMKLPAGTYTKAILDVNKQEIQGIGLHCRLNNSAGSDVFSGTRFGTATLNEETTIFVRLRVFSGYTLNNVTVYPMITSGEYTLETVPDYEIYTGGMASPNPSYPQPIYNAGDSGSITEKIENEGGTEVQNISIPCQQPMRSIGNVKDEFVKVNDVWYERHYINSVVLTGEEEIGRPENTNLAAVRNMSQFAYCTNSNTVYTAECSHENHFMKATSSSNGMGFYNSKIYWINDKFENMTPEQVQTFLASEYQAGHPVTVNHIPPTPTDLLCSTEQIEVLESLPQLKSYRTTTHIYSSDTTPATVNATYRQDLTVLRDRTNDRLDELEARMELVEN